MKRTLDFLDSGALAFAAPLFRDVRASGDMPASEPLDALLRQLVEDAAETPLPPGGLAVGPGSPYVIERKIARGGMATVFLARDVKHDRQVAIKVLDPRFAARIGAEHFAREIHVAARLQHPHVLGLLDSGVFGADVGSFAGRPYYVMPYVEGESLRERLARGRLPVGDAVRVLREVADALAYAHQQGIVHRDIKPENILLSREHAMVADFGVAKALVVSRSEAPDTVLGTPRYMAPEQAVHGAPVDHRADLYSWGMMAYELLAGRHPFDLAAGAHGRVPPLLRRFAPDVPAGIAAIVMQCLGERPEERPSSAEAILKVFDAAAAAGTSSVSTLPLRRLGIGLAAAAVLAIGTREALARRTRQVLVAATGDALRDVAAVQAAVSRGGNVTLKGRFSFAAPPAQPLAAPLASGMYPPAAEIRISRAVSISGVRDSLGEMATIESGTIPFYVDAPGKYVTIRGLRFVRPSSAAILVRGVDGLEISACRIEGLAPFPKYAEGIAINTRGSMPLPTSPGSPEDVTGQIVITRNEIDGSGGRADAPTGGIMVFSVGQSPGQEAGVDIIGNTVTNTSSATINIRGVAGNLRVVGNTLRTSLETSGDVDAVRLVNATSIVMADNVIESKWPNAAAIQIFNPFVEWSTPHTVVEDNDVFMSPPPGVPLGEYDAGISIRGYTDSVVVRHNTISGRARAALSMYAFRGGVPADNAFIDNRLERFTATLADIFIGPRVARARVAGPGSLLDQGSGTLRQSGRGQVR